jgi:hypothetical protein
MIIGFATFFWRRPTKLHVPLRLQTFDAGALPDYPVRVLSDDELLKLKQTSRKQHVTLNDLFARDLCVAMHRWNAHHGVPRSGPIRVIVPINLRTQEQETMPAANVVAMVFVDRKPAWYFSSNWLLKTIAWELRFIRRFRLALAFSRGTAIGHRIPGGLRFLTRASRCYATCVFSNMGNVLGKTPLPYVAGQLVAGELRLEIIESGPPVRPHTPVSLSCVSYAGQTRLSLIYDRQALAGRAAEAIFRTILEQIGVESPAAPAAVEMAPAA